MELDRTMRVDEVKIQSVTPVRRTQRLLGKHAARVIVIYCANCQS